MTVRELAEKLSLTAAAMPEKDREILHAYCGDLLSWVMGRAQAGDAWITIMSNVNVIAVASLADTACVIFAEGVQPDGELVKLAREKGVNLLCSDQPIFETAARLAALL